MLSRLLCLLVFLPLVSGGLGTMDIAAQDATQDDDLRTKAVTTWLSQSAHTLKTVEAGNGFEDLQPLAAALKGVSIIGLGEGSHGTREFFQIKHRLVEFLVKKMGFRLIVVELSYATTLAINDYVLSGKADRRAIVEPKPWPVDTQEWSTLIEWVRAYNQTVPARDRIEFLGYDTKPNRTVLDLITAYLRRVAPAQIQSATRALSPVLDERPPEMDLAVTLPNAGRPERTDEQRAQISDGLKRLVEFFTANESKFISLSSRPEFNRAMHLVQTVAQYDDIFSRPWVSQTEPMKTGIAIREVYASQNVEWFLKNERPGNKIILWAHDVHVSTGYVFASVPTLGSYLRAKFGAAYYGLALMFNRGSFQARNLNTEDPLYGSVMEFSIGSAVPGTAEWYLARPGLKNYYVDFRSAPKDGPVAEFLNSSLLMRYLLGGAFSNRWRPAVYTRPIVLRQYYDGIAFIDETTRARPNPSGIRLPIGK